MTAASLCEILLSSSEQLQEDALLDVDMFIDGWGDRLCQSLVHVRLRCELLNHLHTLLWDAVLQPGEFKISQGILKYRNV